MEAFHFACLFFSLSIGKISGYEIQPVDAVLFIDGAPTYLRITNSTSLENVYACVLENSKNVNSVIMATQMRGLMLDVGQVEETVNESIRRLSGRTGQSLWKSEEDLKMLKARLARFLTIDYYDNRPDPEAYLGYKFQRSTDWSRGRAQPRIYSAWRESSSATPEQGKESAIRTTGLHPFLTSVNAHRLASSSESPTEKSSTKTYTITTKQYSPVETTAAYKIIPAGSYKPNSSPQPFLLSENVKTEAEAVLNGSDIAVDVSVKPERVRETSDNTSEHEKDKSDRGLITAGHAAPQESKSVIDSENATYVFKQTLTEEGGNSDWSSVKSSEEGDWEDDGGLRRSRKKEEKRDSKKKSMKE